MILSPKSFLAYVISAIFISVVAVAAGPKTTANVPNSAGVAEMYPGVDAIPGGARVKAQFHMAKLGSRVSWAIVAPVIDSNGNKQLIEIARPYNMFTHDNVNYQVTQTHDLNYAQVNAWLKQKAPNANLEIGPGTPLYVYARWMNDPIQTDMYTDGAVRNHEWGGVGRSGLFTLPGGSANSGITTGFTNGGVTDALDVKNNIYPGYYNRTQHYIYNGTVGSRFENELKLHIDVNDIPKVSQFFETLEKDPNLVEKTFGQGWKLVANRKFVGQPMIDDYMDNATHDAASIGMALRERTGSGVTSLNYKPNDGRYAGNGIYERIEYDARGLPRVSDANMKKFADSSDPLNPFQLIRGKVPGSTPSDFFVPRLKITDERLKYELEAPSGEKVEISVDHVKARKLDPTGAQTGPTAEYGQLEVEVDHLGASGSNNTTGGNTSGYFSDARTLHDAALDTYLAGLRTGSSIVTEIPPVFHGEKDFDSSSPIKTKNAGSFKLAFDVFDKIREGAFGKSWFPSGQKYAVAAAALGMVQPDRYAPSVDRMIKEKLGNQNPTQAEKLGCMGSLVKISGS